MSIGERKKYRRDAKIIHMAEILTMDGETLVPAIQQRRSLYTPEIEADILARLASGEGLHSICQTEDYPDRRTVLGWLQTIPGLSLKYARARTDGLDAVAWSIMDIADNLEEDPNSRRIRVEARKWVLSKLRPDKYGDRVAVEHSVGESVADVLRKRRAALSTVTLPPGAIQTPASE